MRPRLKNGGEAAPTHPPRWLQSLGGVAFLFFLVKGLLWLLVPALVVALHSIRN